MRYQFEYNGNTSMVSIHSTVRIADNFMSSAYYDTPQDIKDLHSIMQMTEGVSDCTVWPYHVTLTFDSVFEQEEVLQAGWERLKAWLIVTGRMSTEEICTQKSTLRNDINYHQCEQCRKEQEEMYRELKD